MKPFTERKLRANIGRVQIWFTLQDVVKYYLIEVAGEPVNHEALGKLIGKPRSQVSMVLKGERQFTLDNLEELFKQLNKYKKMKRKSEVFSALNRIALDMEEGEIKKEDYLAKIEAARKRGPKPKPNAPLGKDEWASKELEGVVKKLPRPRKPRPE